MNGNHQHVSVTVPEGLLEWPAVLLLGVLTTMLLAFAVGGLWIISKRRSRQGIQPNSSAPAPNPPEK
jgi:hypothetical protein